MHGLSPKSEQETSLMKYQNVYFLVCLISFLPLRGTITNILLRVYFKNELYNNEHFRHFGQSRILLHP